MQGRDSERGGNTESSVLELSAPHPWMCGLVWEKLCTAGLSVSDTQAQRLPEILFNQHFPLWIGYFIY